MGDRILERRVGRRSVIKAGAGGAFAANLAFFGNLATMPNRPVLAAGPPTNRQFDIGPVAHPAQTINGVQVQFGVVFQLFAPARLNRTPSRADQTTLTNALNTIEAVYPFSPSGVMIFLAYGRPYFNRLPQTIVSANMPRLLSNNNRFALEEAVPSPTDVVPVNGNTMANFNVPVRI
jgi:hypothetical protein